jgi:hypothetical protein
MAKLTTHTISNTAIAAVQKSPEYTPTDLIEAPQASGEHEIDQKVIDGEPLKEIFLHQRQP